MHDDTPPLTSFPTLPRRRPGLTAATVTLSFSLVSAFSLLSSPAAFADLKISSETTGKAMGRDTGGESVVYIKGTKMRSESNAGGRRFVSILDLDKRQMIVLNDKKRRAEVFDLTSTAQVLRQVEASDVKLEPLGTTPPTRIGAAASNSLPSPWRTFGCIRISTRS